MTLQRQQSNGHTQFSYQWPDAPALQFQLADEHLNTYRGLRRYQPHMAEQAVRNALIRKSASLQQQHRGSRILLSAPNLPLSFTVQAQDRQIAAQLQQEMASTQQKALQDHLYQGYYFLLQDSLKGQGVIPDHVRYMQDALPQLQPVADAFITLYGKQNVRDIAIALTRWVQQIPYRDMENRISSNGQGYVAPTQLIYDHQGDCDSKAVLWATIMRHIFPTLEIRILYLPEHAVIAAQIPATETEQIIELGTDSLLLVDPTGPALLKLGQIGDKYQPYLKNKQFTQRAFPHRKISAGGSD
jgi:hypothetical protein